MATVLLCCSLYIPERLNDYLCDPDGCFEAGGDAPRCESGKLLQYLIDTRPSTRPRRRSSKTSLTSSREHSRIVGWMLPLA